MLAKYFRGGLGQLLAPDENYVPEQEPEAKVSLMQILAPDPKFAEEASKEKKRRQIATNKASSPPAVSPFMSPAARQQQQKVECEHCHKFTPVRPQPPSPSVFETPTQSSVMVGNSQTAIFSPEAEHVKNLVWVAVEDVAKTMHSPAFARKPEMALFEFCANTAPTEGASVTEKVRKKRAKAQARIEKSLQNDPALLQAHACNMGNNPPDGYTPLMAAALADNLQAAELICRHVDNELLAELLQARNFQGKTALHIASEHGHVDMVEFLQREHTQQFGLSSPPPVDMTGCTPYGSAMMSPQPKARSNREHLTLLLYAANDVSIVGTPAPAEHRMQASPALNICWAYADMPGKRILMEDAMFAAVFGGSDADLAANNNKAGALFGVCDGHADSGRVSRYIATEFPTAFECAMTMSGTWEELCEDICLAVDDKLKLTTDLVGGSTAVLACVTEQELVVANVGDSRAILIQRKSSSDGVSELLKYEMSLEEQTEQLSLQDNKEEELSPIAPSVAAASAKKASPGLSTAPTMSSSWDNYRVVALSTDHKPNLEAEKARVEAAGLTVVEEKFTDETTGQPAVLHKVALNDNNRLATSRSFGDFEYKQNKSLTDEQQAIVAVPEVTVHKRNADTDAYLVLACDGVWDVMSNEQVGQFVVENIADNSSSSNERTAQMTALPDVADRLLAKCLELGSTDNMSIQIVALSKVADKLSGAMSPDGKKALNFEPAE